MYPHVFKWPTLLKLGLPYLIFFFTPIVGSLIAIGILIMTDVYTGVRAAQTRGEEIHSRGLSRTVTKIIFYALAILLSRMVEIVFIPWLPVSQITAGYIGVVEFKSNMENIGTITGIDLWNALKETIENTFKRNIK